jgi:hypothetical protein
MAEERPDRFAAGSGGDAEADAAERDDFRPGVTGGGRNYLPEGGRASDASSAEGTVGAVGEMDLAGAPAGTASAGGSAAGVTEGGGPGGGAKSSGGTGPADADQ